ncbi:hypothetical protein ACWF7H_29305 [Peribacillus butanolivorans]|uniref:hypothetical protein n=1 Tax=Peribacillus butanolivorans TaxID=421767 RepID=UPI0036C911F4
MATWGTAIFSDDFAEDVQLHYKDLIAEGYSSEEATKILVEQSLKAEEFDEEDTTVFWLSLAAIQWKLGRLEENVKKIAVEIIDNGSDLKRWDDEPSLIKKREKVLLKLKEQLISPQPLPKKVSKRFIPQTSLRAKDVISYRLQSGKYIILKVLGIEEEWDGSKYPLFEICDWIGYEPSFDKNEIEALPLLREPWENGKLIKLAIFPKGKKDYPKEKVTLIAKNVQTIQQPNTPYTLLSWKELDYTLVNNYKIK